MVDLAVETLVRMFMTQAGLPRFKFQSCSCDLAGQWWWFKCLVAASQVDGALDHGVALVIGHGPPGPALAAVVSISGVNLWGGVDSLSLSNKAIKKGRFCIDGGEKLK